MIWMLFACKSSKQMYMKLLKEEWLESSSLAMLEMVQNEICHGCTLMKQSWRLLSQLVNGASNSSRVTVNAKANKN
jgi:hypothetical protein